MVSFGRAEQAAAPAADCCRPRVTGEVLVREKMKSIRDYLSHHPLMTPFTLDVRSVAPFARRTPAQAADAYVESLGFSPVGEGWNTLSREEAFRSIVTMLVESLAYHCPMLEKEDAERVAGELLSSFPSPRAVFLNNSETIEPGAVAWSPISQATFDAAIVALDEVQIGVLCIEDED